MDTLSTQASLLASHNIFLAYLLVYGATIFFGNIGAFTSLWISFQGGFGPWDVPFVLLAIFAANVSGDLIWYSMGRSLRATRLGNWIKRRIPNHEKFEEHIGRKGRRWMLIAKFAYGTNFPIIFSIGWTGALSFRQFFRNSLLAIGIWLPIILGVCYGLYAGLAPLATAIRTVKDFEFVFLGALVLFLVVQYGLVKLFGKLDK